MTAAAYLPDTRSLQRGEPVDSPLAEIVLATIHPSAILCVEDREAEYAGFVADLRKVAALL